MRYTLDEIKYGTGFAPGAVFESVEKYNGWANRETWAVALHINNDQGWQESVHEALREGPYASEGFTLEEARQAFYNAPRSIEHMAGEIIRDSVEGVFDIDVIEVGMGKDAAAHYVKHILPIRDDIGSLWRVDWTELGSAFLADLDES